MALKKRSPSPGGVFASDELRTLVEIGRVIGSQPEIDRVFDRVAGLIRQVIPFDRLAVVVIEPASGMLGNRYVAGMPISGRSRGDRYPAAGTMVEGLARTRLFSNKRPLARHAPIGRRCAASSGGPRTPCLAWV